MNQAAINALLAILAPGAAAVASGKPARAKGKRKGYHQKPKGRQPLSEADKAAYMAGNDAAAVEAFTKAGFKDVQPRVNVLTYNKWIAAGFKVKKGQKSIKVNNFPLFHQDQVEPLAAQPETSAVN